MEEPCSPWLVYCVYEHTQTSTDWTGSAVRLIILIVGSCNWVEGGKLQTLNCRRRRLMRLFRPELNTWENEIFMIDVKDDPTELMQLHSY